MAAQVPGTLLLISHDREFLDNVATHTLHLHGGTAKLYVGGYTDFERQRIEHLRQQQIAHDKEQAERAHLQSFIDRFKAQASKATQAQSRMKRLAKMAGTEAVRAEREFRIQFAQPNRLPFSLIRLNHLDAGYAASPRESGIENGDSQKRGSSDAITVLHDVGFGLEAGDRIGLLGPNGAGKSTLVKTLVGELAPLSGERSAHPDLRIATSPSTRWNRCTKASRRWTISAICRRTVPIRHSAISWVNGISLATVRLKWWMASPVASARVLRWR